MDCHIFLIRPAKYQTCLSDQWKCFQRFLAACGLIGLVLLNRKPSLPSPSISQSEPSRRETWRWDLNRLTTSWRVRLSPCVICSWFQQVNWLIIELRLTGDMHIGGQEHFYLETNVTLAVPRGEDGEMELFVSTQSAAKTQVTILTTNTSYINHFIYQSLCIVPYTNSMSHIGTDSLWV